MIRLFLSFYVVFALSAFSDVLVGKVVSVADGDTVTVLDDAKVQHKIRLWGIDAPEKGQDFGNRSRQAMAEMVFQRSVKVDVVDKDHYGRSIGKIYVGELYVNLEMVKKGMAWWYRQYAPKDQVLRDAEKVAREAKEGLWSRADAMPPWEWRRMPKEAINNKLYQPSEQGDKKAPLHEGPYWVTSSSGKTHNSTCRHYQKTKGYECKKGSGDDCKVCGGRG